jgi:protein O-mannosyl-transferase
VKNNPFNWRVSLAICALLSASILLAYCPLTRQEFVNYDDAQYITENAHVLTGLTLANLKWAFQAGYASNWHPLTWISHMLDVQLFGLNAGAHHAVSLGIHTANTLLLFILLNRLTGRAWHSAFVAGLFALHPLHVESVAWAAERKDVLSGLFFILTLLAYTKYTRGESEARIPKHETRFETSKSIPQTSEKPQTSKLKAESDQRSRNQKSEIKNPRGKVWYIASLLLFVLGLMSKPMLVTVPFVLLLLDFWPLQRIRRAENSKGVLPLFWEKIPYLVLSLASSVVTFLAQRSGGAVASLETLPLTNRLATALIAYGNYLLKMIWPRHLAIMYLPPNHWPAYQIVLAVALLAGITVLAVFLRQSRPYLLVGWLWFVGMLVPVIGLVQVGNQFIADRYTYLPFIGCFIALTWAAAELFQRLRLSPVAPAITAVSCLLLCAAVTHAQSLHWQDGETLFQHCLKVTENNFIAHNNLAVVLAKKGRFPEAKNECLHALEIRPRDADCLQNAGVVLTQKGDYDEALGYISALIDIRPQAAAIYKKLGGFLESEAKLHAALKYYEQSLRYYPDDIELCNNVAWVRATHQDATLRDGKEAIVLAERACEISARQHPVFLGTLAGAYAEAGRFAEAVKTAEKAIALADATAQPAIAARNRELLALYRQGKAYHERAAVEQSSAAK